MNGITTNLARKRNKKQLGPQAESVAREESIERWPVLKTIQIPY